jgi:hypothetical protein
MGIDGRIFPVAAAPKKRGAEAGELDFMDAWYPIQVKQTDRVGRPDIDAFEAVIMREDRTKGSSSPSTTPRTPSAKSTASSARAAR